MLLTDPLFLKLFLPLVPLCSLLALVVKPVLLRPVLIAASLYFMPA